MRIRFAVAVLAILIVASVLIGLGWSEVSFQSVSVTATSQTIYFSAPRSAVMLCSSGVNDSFYRLFDENDVNTGATGVATTANALLIAGSSTAPVCVSWTKAATQGAFFKAISLVCDTAQTATVKVYSE